MSAPAAGAACRTNTAQSYGSVTKTFHWLTALLILTAFPLGLIANGYPFDTADQLATKALLFSAHKTVGITAFWVAFARILWALPQKKPQPLHPERRLEHFAAETTHWMLYGAMMMVPLSGWLHHAATTGFAPIWWPFGQSLPGVPKSAALADVFAAWHWLFTKLLGLAVLLHIAGALKHHVMDRDDTLRRMLPGLRGASPLYTADETPDQTAARSRAPLWAALAIWALAMTGGTMLGVNTRAHDTPGSQPPPLAAAASQWQVEQGRLEISVHQFGADVRGQFDTWSAAIVFDPEATGDRLGQVTVEIAIPSLRLGSVSDQALGAGFLDAAGHPVATYTADILRKGTGYLADGTLSLRGVSVPVQLPFTLALEGDHAEMTGTTVLDRRDFGVGMEAHGDDSNLGFAVRVDVALVAERTR